MFTLRVTQVTADHDGDCEDAENEERHKLVTVDVIVSGTNSDLVQRVWREFPDILAMNELFTFRFYQWIGSVKHAGGGGCNFSAKAGLRHEIAIVSNAVLPSTIMGTHDTPPDVCHEVNATLRYISYIYIGAFTPTRDWWYRDSCILVRHRIKLFLLINNRRGLLQRLPKDVVHLICGELSTI